MRTKIETITPQRAARDLKKAEEADSNFRNLIPGRLEAMVRCMTEERWEPNGDSVSYNGNGELVDGQHRFVACVKADKPFETVVVYGVEDTIHKDTGAKRQAGQVLTRRLKIVNGTLVAAIVRLVEIRNSSGSVITESGGGAYQPDIKQILDYTKAHKPALKRSAAVGVTCRPYCTLTAGGYVHYQACKITRMREEADDFFHCLTTGTFPKDHPGRLILPRLVQNRTMTGAQYRLTRIEEIALLTRAWNAFALGDNPTKITLAHGRSAWTPENFPDLVESE